MLDRRRLGLIKYLLRELHDRGILTEDLVLPDKPEALEVTYRGLCRKDAASPRRRIGWFFGNSV